jgi:hypothetical protein
VGFHRWREGYGFLRHRINVTEAWLSCVCQDLELAEHIEERACQAHRYT